MEGVEWPWHDLITFLANSEKPRDFAMRNTGFVVLSHHSMFCVGFKSWSYVHAVFYAMLENCANQLYWHRCYWVMVLIAASSIDRGTGHCFRSISFFLSLFFLLARLRENGWTDLHEISREGAKWPWDDMITFLVNSEKPCTRCRDAQHGFVTGFVVL